ncbi:hypothetical protein NPIL_697351 [Nephila pilipes]|uniref:Uncharacterized protein n=1 Tax=Nephila pilipes TaxID=299642 RepID=A0A8X6TSF5_NEPPI|nr:hypothetical protein NPIL_697351 [Nephila pilipes]
MNCCRIRDVEDFDSHLNSIISDKIFETVDISTHIAVTQGEGWLLPEQLSRDSDIHVTVEGGSFEKIKFEKRWLTSIDVMKDIEATVDSGTQTSILSKAFISDLEVEAKDKSVVE